MHITWIVGTKDNWAWHNFCEYMSHRLPQYTHVISFVDYGKEKRDSILKAATGPVIMFHKSLVQRAIEMGIDPKRIILRLSGHRVLGKEWIHKK